MPAPRTISTVAAIALGVTSVCGAVAPETAQADAHAGAREVVILGRTWTVELMEDTEAQYVATRDNNNLNPFGVPNKRKTPQAVAAIEKATGCRVIRDSLYQNVAAQFFAQVRCR